MQRIYATIASLFLQKFFAVSLVRICETSSPAFEPMCCGATGSGLTLSATVVVRSALEIADIADTGRSVRLVSCQRPLPTRCRSTLPCVYRGITELPAPASMMLLAAHNLLISSRGVWRYPVMGEVPRLRLFFSVGAAAPVMNWSNSDDCAGGSTSDRRSPPSRSAPAAFGR